MQQDWFTAALWPRNDESYLTRTRIGSAGPAQSRSVRQSCVAMLGICAISLGALTRIDATEARNGGAAGNAAPFIRYFVFMRPMPSNSSLVFSKVSGFRPLRYVSVSAKLGAMLYWNPAVTKPRST